MKTIQKKNQRLKRKVATLQDVAENLRKSNRISDTGIEVLEKSFAGVPLEVMKRLLQSKKSSQCKESYHPILRSFALTLQFYSTKANNYVRKTFGLGLPHITTIRQWYSRLNGAPGFTAEVFASLEMKAKEAKDKGDQILCSLMMDEMALRKDIEWDGQKNVGFVDIGTDVNDNESMPAASEALVFMVVCANGSWKVPVGFFLIDKLNGSERANLIKQCIRKLYDVGITVISLTCNGPACNFSMLRELGATMTLPLLDATFPHPSRPDDSVYIFLDVCHMLKLIRNTLASIGEMIDDEGNIISWRYINELHKLQQEEGLHLGNKLRSAQVAWTKQKMKANLAAQTLSTSVADAIAFCREYLKLPQFAGSEPTCRFIKLVDQLFDILNSRNPLGKYFKAPMRPSNEHKWMHFLDEAYEYIASLSDLSGKPMHITKKKTAFIGFMVAITSVKSLYEKYVKGNDAPLHYLLTYKLSQDHLELLFGAIRSSCGCNNNPNVRQFIAAYKRLLMRHEVETSTGNCTALDVTRILQSATSSNTMRKAVPDESEDIAVARRYGIIVCPPSHIDYDYADITNFSQLSPFKDAVVGYIAGYVVRMVRKKINCSECKSALISDGADGFDEPPSCRALLTQKNRGGLLQPSVSVIKICKETEKSFQRLLHTLDENLPHSDGLASAISTTVLQAVVGETFEELENHMFDSEPDNNHIFALIKCIVKCYCKIRFHHMTKRFNEKISGPKGPGQVCSI